MKKIKKALAHSQWRMRPGLFEVGSLELERGRVSIRNPPTQDTCSNDVAQPCPPNDCGCRPLKGPGFVWVYWAIPLFNYTPLQMTIYGVQGGIGNMSRGGGGGVC